MKTHILYSIIFFRKSHRLWGNVEKYGGDRGPTKDVTTWRIRFACWISKATCTYVHAHAHAPAAHTHADKCVILIAFPRQKWFAKSDRAYFIRTLPVVFHVSCAFLGIRMLAGLNVSRFVRLLLLHMASWIIDLSIDTSTCSTTTIITNYRPT